MIETYISRVILCNLVVAMDEIWKDIQGYEGKYQVSNTGLVRSMNFNHITGLVKTIAQKTDRYGYKVVQLHNNGERKHITVHRLVAKTFIPNENKLPQINHIDGNKSNNSVLNLEWCTGKENMEHGRKNGLFKNTEIASIKRRIEVTCASKTSGYIEYFPSQSHAAKAIGATVSEISEVVRGNRKSTHGFLLWSKSKGVVV